MRKFLLIGLAASCAVAVVNGQIVNGQTTTTTTTTTTSETGEPETKQTQDAAEDEDITLIANTFKWTKDMAMMRMKAQDVFATLVARLELELPKQFAGSEMPRTALGKATLYFAGEIADTLRSSIGREMEAVGLIPVFVTDMKYSMDSQELRADDIVGHLRNTFGFKEVSTAILPGDLILVTIPETDDFPFTRNEGFIRGPSQLDPLAKKLLDGSGIDSYGVKFNVAKGEFEQDHHTRGGRKVYGGGHQCTSGFTVYRQSDGVTGVTTAAHCDGMAWYDSEDGADYALTHKAQHNGKHGDVEWKTTSHIEPAEYWASTTSLRDVTSIKSSFSKNDVVCVYSRMQSRRSCDFVYSTSVMQSGARHLVATDSDLTVGGDSGGPWSYGTQAAGITKGGKVIWFYWRSTFTKANRFDDALGVVVRRV